jgi:hypothetical protein
MNVEHRRRHLRPLPLPPRHHLPHNDATMVNATTVLSLSLSHSPLVPTRPVTMTMNDAAARPLL